MTGQWAYVAAAYAATGALTAAMLLSSWRAMRRAEAAAAALRRPARADDGCGG